MARNIRKTHDSAFKANETLGTPLIIWTYSDNFSGRLVKERKPCRDKQG